ncbi:heme-dependent oxidative N-demethylase family protein [Acidithiobacillus ferrianus]|uniref:heme-dependent oxidative N-demethylase family protein n=1 Tax=Acidithiobacillus ferrianus TaxID=2678518 RepID=UPI0034E57B90
MIKMKLESYACAFTFNNSDEAIARFPFPFKSNEYMYYVDVKPYIKGPIGSPYEHLIDVDEHYISEVYERKRILEQDRSRYGALSHMKTAQWDALEYIMINLSRDYPEYFGLETCGSEWIWRNNILNISDKFKFGDCATLTMEPLEYITRQCQGDFFILDQRDNNLYLDAGMVTFAADFSAQFDFGMSFHEIHGPVPLAHEMGVYDRVLNVLLNLRIEEPLQRLNWTLTVFPMLDTSTERYHQWGINRSFVTCDNAGEIVFLRVELQTFIRLPRSNSLMLTTRTYLLSLNDLASNREWLSKFYSIMRSLNDKIAEYKGFAKYRNDIITWSDRRLNQ